MREEEERSWVTEFLDDVFHGRPTRVHVGPAVYFARSLPKAGLPWIRRLAHSVTATDHSRAVACHFLAGEGEQPPIDLVRVLLVSESCWARFHAALASRGPWASLLVPDLERALGDTAVLSDMDDMYRVSDLAALALMDVDQPPASEAMRNWFSSVRGDLTCQDATARNLATFVLAELGDRAAFVQLERLAAGKMEFQAQSILERLREKREPG